MAVYSSLHEIDTNCLPLPIAYEVAQLKQMPTGYHLQRCRQLISTFEFAIRYCAVLVLSEYRRLTTEYGFRSADFDVLIADHIDNPTIDVCIELINMMMRHCRHHEDRLVVPNLYGFTFQPDGTSSPVWTAVQQLQILAGKLETRNVSLSEMRLAQDFDINLRHLLGLLGALEWLKDYELLRVYDCTEEAGGVYNWIARQPQDEDAPPRELREQRTPCKPGHTLLVRSVSSGRCLVLLPFAIFTRHEHRPNDGKGYLDDFFYYENLEYGSMTYVGLRNDEKEPLVPERAVRTTLDEYVEFITALKEGAGASGIEPTNWAHLTKRCAAITQDQLQVFYVDKYDPGVYVDRESVLTDWEAFLAGPQVGFFVVGDSGTGKTNFMCSLADKLKDRGEAVILYNCADIRETSPDVASTLARSLILPANVYERLYRLGANSGGQDRWLYLLFDAVNESGSPAKLMDSLVELARELALLGAPRLKVKLVATCRTETWGRLKSGFKGDQYFYKPHDEVAIRLQRFELDELEKVYTKYRGRYDIKTAYKDLHDNVKNFIRDPLMMRLVCTSFRGQPLEKVPKTRQVFENYYKAKIGYTDDARTHEDLEEQLFVEQILQLMVDAGREELDIETDLRKNPDLRQMMLDKSLTTPFWQLRDKGVLTVFGRLDATDREPRKVKFTYDRFFEYLVQKQLFGGQPLGLASKQNVVAAIRDSGKFVSLWGAVRIALQMYLDEHEVTDTPLLEAMARGDSTDADPQVQAMLIDMLVEYALNDREKVKAFVMDVLLPMETSAAGRIAVQTCYEVGLVEGLHAGLLDKTDEVRQRSTQYVFYLWQRSPAPGLEVMQRLYEGIERQFRTLGRSVIIGLLRTRKPAEAIQGLTQFMNLAVLIVGYAYMGGSRVYAAGRIWAQFAQMISRSWLAKALDIAFHYWGHSFVVKAVDGAEVYNTQLLSVVFEYGVDHEYRACLAEFAEYLNPKKPIPQRVQDRMFAVALAPIGTPMFFIAMTYYARAKLPERNDTLKFCKRLFYEGNIYSKNLALRIAALIEYMENLGGEYLEFVEEMLCELWTGKEAEYEYPIKKSPLEEPVMRSIRVGYLQYPVIHECRTKTGGASEFIHRIMALPWHGDPVERIVRIIACLEDGLCVASATFYTNVAPMLGTIAEWVTHEDDRVHAAMVSFLCLARSFYPTQVDQFLDGLLDDWSAAAPERAGKVRGVVRDVREGQSLRPLDRLWAGTGIVAVPWVMQSCPMFVDSFAQLLARIGTSKDATWDEALKEFGSKVGTLDMLLEVAALLSGEGGDGRGAAPAPEVKT